MVNGSCVDGMDGVYRRRTDSAEMLPIGRLGMLSRQSSVDSDGVIGVSSLSHNAVLQPTSMRPSYAKCDSVDGDDQWILHYRESTGDWTFESRDHDSACCHDQALYPVDIATEEWKVWMAKESRYIECGSLQITAIDVVAHVLESKRLVQVQPVHHYQPVGPREHSADLNGTYIHCIYFPIFLVL